MATDKNGNKEAENGSEDEEEEEEEGEGEEGVVPPDGGWGWVIVFVGFMGGVIVDGIIFSFGIVFAEILVAFDEGKSKTAWVGSTMAGMYLIIGPVVSALANRYGCKMMAIVGSIIGAAALAASVFATSIDFLILTFGVIGGIGFGFIYLPCIVMVQFYFDKKRAFATGISVCGSGMGAFIFAPLSSFLIGEYGWRGNMLIQSAIVLHMAALAMLLRPLKVPKRPPPPPPVARPPLIVVQQEANSPKINNSFPKSFSTQSFRTYHADSQRLAYDIQGLNMSDEQMKTMVNNIPAMTIEETAEDEAGEENKVVEEQLPMNPRKHYRRSIDHNNQPNFAVGDSTIVKVLNRRKSLPVDMKEEVTRPFYRQDIFFSGSLMRIPQYSSNPSLHQYRCSIVSMPKEQQLTLLQNKKGKWRAILCPKTIRHTINTMLDFSLLKSATFVVLCAASFITMTGFFIPFVYLADYAINEGISMEDAAFLFSVIGIANTLGRVFSGWVSDRPNVNALFITNVALTTGGLATAFVPLMHSYHELIAYSAIFGLAIACFASLRSIILVELLGLEKLTNAFGLLLLFQGLASMIGSPMAGFFYDVTLSYDVSFFIAGGLIALSGLMGFPLPYVARWEERRKK